MNADTALLVGLTGIAAAARHALPLTVHAWRRWRCGSPDFRPDHSTNDREWKAGTNAGAAAALAPDARLIEADRIAEKFAEALRT